jgi:hypothetical protein
VLVAALGAWRVAASLSSLSIPVVGDGAHVESYGFDLSNCRVPRAQLVAAGFPKDGLPILNYPRALTLAGADELTHELREKHLGKFIVGKEAVIGVVAGGKPRAYPLRLLTWHEVVNDELGGVPLAVTYNPLCNAVVVFDRRVAGRVLELGVSGLLYNSNLLLHDRQPEGAGESLWSQLLFQAIAGPYAAEPAALTVLPVQVMTWQEWKARHPETTVIAPDLDRLPLYKRTYGEYFGSDTLRFPVAPLPEYRRPYKTPVIAVRPAQRWHVFTWEQIAQQAGPDGSWDATVDGQPLRFVHRRDEALVGNPAAVWIEAPAAPVVYSFWFAWYAHHPDEAALESEPRP